MATNATGTDGQNVKLSWKASNASLTDTEIKRFACLFLHSDFKAIDYNAAAADFGSASGNSMRIMTNAALKKVREASAQAEENGEGSNDVGSGDAAVIPPKPKGGGKRSKAPEQDGTNGDGQGQPKKARAAPKKMKKAPTDNDAKGAVKSEGGVKSEPQD